MSNNLFELVSFKKSKSHKESGKSFSFDYSEYSEESASSSEWTKERGHKGGHHGHDEHS